MGVEGRTQRRKDARTGSSSDGESGMGLVLCDGGGLGLLRVVLRYCCGGDQDGLRYSHRFRAPQRWTDWLALQGLEGKRGEEGSEGGGEGGAGGRTGRFSTRQ
jgi:hypothetical protein